METDDLINILTQVPPIKRPLRLGALTALITVLSALATVAVLGLRPELVAGHPPASFWMKTLLLAAMAVIGLGELTRASKPIAARRTLWPMLLLVAFVVAVLTNEWLTTDYRKILAGFLMPNFPSCLICVTIYGALGMAGFTFLMRQYAPVDAKQCAGLIGLAAAAAGAVGYSIHCPLDSPTFIIVAYGLPMIALSIVGRLALPRYLKW